jgi:hypothetical protein
VTPIEIVIACEARRISIGEWAELASAQVAVDALNLA